MSSFENAIQQLLQHEENESDSQIGAVLIPNNSEIDIQDVFFERQNLAEQVANYFPPESDHLEPVSMIVDFENPSSTTIHAVYLSSDRSGMLYNNRAAELFQTNVSNNVLLFELDSYGLFTTNAEVLRTTIVDLCDEARQEGLFSTVFRALQTRILESRFGSWLEGINSTTD